MFAEGTVSNFGSGVASVATTALVRFPALLASVFAVAMTGELIIKGISAALDETGLKPADDSWIKKASNKLTEYGARPYRNTEISKLVLGILGFGLAGIIGNELANLALGKAPLFYNHALTFLGPIRVDTRPYMEGMRNIWGM